MVTERLEEKVEQPSYELMKYITRLIGKGHLKAYSFETRNFVSKYEDESIAGGLLVRETLKPIKNLSAYELLGNLHVLIRHAVHNKYSLTFQDNNTPYIISSSCTLEKLADGFYFDRKETGEIYIPPEQIVSKIGIHTTSDRHGDYRKNTLFVEDKQKDVLFEKIYNFAIGLELTEKQQSL